MRIGLIEVGHWHARMYVEALRASHANVVAISDRNVEVARNVAAEMGCNSYSDYRELVATEELDFAFAFGRHFEMPAIAKLLIDNRINFAIEKPVGVDFQQVDELSKLAEEKGVFVAVPFVFRMAPWVQRLIELKREGKFGQLVHLNFRYIAGPPSRYVKWGCSWMLDREQAGGGCTINLGIHFIDLFQYLAGGKIRRIFARMSKKVHKQEIEDHSTLVLESDDVLGIVETGYTHPFTSPDWQYVVITSNNYFIVNEELMRHRSEDGEKLLSNPSGLNLYAEFVMDTLERFKAGRKPVAGLEDALNALRVVNLAYKSDLSHMPVELKTLSRQT